MTRIKLGLLAIAALSAASLSPAHAADGIKALIQTQHLQAEQDGGERGAAPAKKSVRKLQAGRLPAGGIIKGNSVAELSAQDCKNVGGKVIDVADDRCGSTRKYCRMPDTNAVCIDVAQ